jgi:hypothetical protein
VKVLEDIDPAEMEDANKKDRPNVATGSKKRHELLDR